MRILVMNWRDIKNPAYGDLKYLVSRGIIKKVGKTGKYTYYRMKR